MTTLERKPVFDFVRRLLGRGFTQAEVEQLDELLDARMTPDVPSRPERAARPITVGVAGLKLITGFEGCHRMRKDGRFEAYPDPGSGGDPWTIGWGSTGPGITRGTVWTQEECDVRLQRDLRRYADDVLRALGSAVDTTSQAQFDALVSFHYNTGKIATATLTRKHKAGDFTGAAREFDRWVYASGQLMKGLVRRRAAERELYARGS